MNGFRKENPTLLHWTKLSITNKLAQQKLNGICSYPTSLTCLCCLIYYYKASGARATPKQGWITYGITITLVGIIFLMGDGFYLVWIRSCGYIGI